MHGAAELSGRGLCLKGLGVRGRRRYRKGLAEEGREVMFHIILPLPPAAQNHQILGQMRQVPSAASPFLLHLLRKHNGLTNRVSFRKVRLCHALSPPFYIFFTYLRIFSQFKCYNLFMIKEGKVKYL